MTVSSSLGNILTASLSLVYRQTGLWRQSENAPQAESLERPGLNPRASPFHRELVMQNKMPAGVTAGRGISNSVIRLPRTGGIITGSYRRPCVGGDHN
jgi:hypothetical protein